MGDDVSARRNHEVTEGLERFRNSITIHKHCCHLAKWDWAANTTFAYLRWLMVAFPIDSVSDKLVFCTGKIFIYYLFDSSLNLLKRQSMIWLHSPAVKLVAPFSSFARRCRVREDGSKDVLERL